MNQEFICPYCASKEFVEATTKHYGNLVPLNKVFTNKEEQVFHTIYLNCGAIVKSYVKNPKKLKNENKRK